MDGRSGLWWGTVEGAALREVVVAAAQAGFTDVSVTPAMYVAERERGATDAELRALLADHGVGVALIDPLIRGLPGVPDPEAIGPRFRSTFAHGEDDCYRAAEALGAGAINVAHFLGAPTGIAELTDAIGALTARAGSRGLDVLVEFMPDGGIADLDAASAIVAAVAAGNCGVMLDTWHHWRCGGTVDDLARLEPGTIKGLQLSDALADVRGSGAQPPTRDRLLPGAGVIPLAEIAALVRSQHPGVIPGVEVFDRELAGLPANERAERAKASLERLRSSADGR